jgi:hypothetical protein
LSDPTKTGGLGPPPITQGIFNQDDLQ